MAKGNITFTMIKPGAVNHEYIGPILTIINDAGFKVVAMKLTRLKVEEAEVFYSAHRSKPFFCDLVDFMTSGPIVAMILKKENAVEDYRKLMGHTDPHKAEEGTIRRMFAEDIEHNAVHGSDSDENAIIESDFFFCKRERFMNGDSLFSLKARE
jgi:nucleoside-diphosphate kinase